MELLTIHHQDFTMSIECTKFMGNWGNVSLFLPDLCG